MPAYAELAGNRVIAATITIPYYGTWVGDVTLALPATLPNNAKLTFGDLSLACTLYRQTDFSGRHMARIVGGAGSWQNTLVARAYQNNSGVLMSQVLTDAAIELGESIGVAALNSISGTTIGTSYVRESMPGAMLLRQITGALWWMDVKGNVQLQSRTILPASGLTSDTVHLGPITSKFQPTDYMAGKGLYVIAHESPSDWMPGRTFTSPLIQQGVQTISMAIHTIEESGLLRTQILTTSPV